jgi:hypothetical protein
MAQPPVILSMLHETADANSATRKFRGEPVLAWTLRRMARSEAIGAATVLCWDDQAEAARAAGAKVDSRGARQFVNPIESVAAARRWADGWRGGLLATCEFDRGFFGPWVEETRKAAGADEVVLVDPAAGLVDPVLLDQLVRHAADHADVDLFFSPAAPGLNGVLIRAVLLEKLAASKTHPGAILTYRPEIPRRDPISDPACVPTPIPVNRTTRRFTLDSSRQIELMTAATAPLNGQLISIDAMGLLTAVEKSAGADSMPRELVMELTTQRATKPIYLPQGIERAAMKIETARAIFAELARRDDARLILAGIGDPLLHDGVIEIIKAARDAGIGAISIESDFVGIRAERVAALAESGVDIVSVHMPAANGATYAAVMGHDALGEVVGNLRIFIEKRQARGRELPLLVPTFTKCRINQGEMEAWYDHWLRSIGSAVISGPSEFAGLIPDVSAADMSPPKRRACGSLWKRLMALSDGTIVSCEQDVTGRQALGRTLTEAWSAAEKLRRSHLAERWCEHSACAACKQWHRP